MCACVCVHVCMYVSVYVYTCVCTHADSCDYYEYHCVYVSILTKDASFITNSLKVSISVFHSRWFSKMLCLLYRSLGKVHHWIFSCENCSW